MRDTVLTSKRTARVEWGLLKKVPMQSSSTTLLKCAAFLLASSGLFAQAPTLRGTLKAARLDDFRAVPLAAEVCVQVAPEGPRATAASKKLFELLKGCCAEADKGRLAFTPAADKQATFLTPAKAHVVTIDGATGSPPVLIYYKDRSWYACSASTLKGTAGKETLQFLDADLDGDFFGPQDFVRHNDLAFRPVDTDHLLLMNDYIGRYEIDQTQRPPRFQIQPVPWPAWSTDEQRFGIGIIAEGRQMAGLPPCLLDEARSKVCQAHANYLYLNKYTFDTSITKTHAEDPKLPGYTEAGAAAAQRVVMTFSGDMMEAVTAQLWAMLHRGAFLGSADKRIGIALKLGSLAGIPGYTVFWGERPDIPPDGFPICFPTSGARGSATFCAREAPAVEDDPAFYNTQRGLAVSVTYDQIQLSNIRLDLFTEEKKGKMRAVPGRLFSHEKPISKTFSPENNRTAFFVANEMLKTETWHMATFHADVQGSTQPLDLVWWFETQK